jgi:hypothetical protein
VVVQVNLDVVSESTAAVADCYAGLQPPPLHCNCWLQPVELLGLPQLENKDYTAVMGWLSSATVAIMPWLWEWLRHQQVWGQQQHMQLSRKVLEKQKQEK